MIIQCASAIFDPFRLDHWAQKLFFFISFTMWRDEPVEIFYFHFTWIEDIFLFWFVVVVDRFYHQIKLHEYFHIFTFSMHFNSDSCNVFFHMHWCSISASLESIFDFHWNFVFMISIETTSIRLILCFFLSSACSLCLESVIWFLIKFSVKIVEVCDLIKLEKKPTANNNVKTTQNRISNFQAY